MMYGKMPCLLEDAAQRQKGAIGLRGASTARNYSKKGCCKKMAKCANCGKSTTFGHNRSFSQRATNRTFKPNLQKTLVMEKGRPVHKLLCAKCIKTLSKTAA
jgi:large subunit ribosomal protein L28